MTDIIVTDLTRFSKRDDLCLAGLTRDGQQCIRPLRSLNSALPKYLTYQQCREHAVLPGTILRADFQWPDNVTAPHTEDALLASQIQLLGPATSDEFRNVLESSHVTTLHQGFGVQIPNGAKLIEPNNPPARSIITLKIRPTQFDVFEDKFNDRKVRAHVTDASGASFKFLPITDLGFHDNIGNPETRKTTVDEAKRLIHQQDELYLRIGLTRRYAHTDGRDGFWIQVNGIYTFPNYSLVVREY